jgi:DNA-directed RNA polymerase subunit RPC12/RpoP
LPHLSTQIAAARYNSHVHGSFYIPGWSNTSKSMGDNATCSRCGYSLKGLKNTARCPECGSVIVIASKGPVEGGTLTQAPMEYLRRFVAGCWLLLLGGILSFTFAPIAYFAIANLPLAGVLLACGLFCWAAGVWIITAPRKLGLQASINTQTEWSRVRFGARWAHLSLVIGIALIIVAQVIFNTATNAFMNNPATFNIPIGNLPGLAPTRSAASWSLLVVGGIFLSAGALGPALLGIYMARLAEWAQDIDLGTRLRMAAAGMIAGPILMILFLGLLPMTKIAPIVFAGIWLGWIGFGLLIICLGQFAWGTLQFVNMGRWAIKNAVAFADSQVAISEKKAELYRSMPLPADASVDVAAPMPTLSKPAETPQRPRSLGNHVLRPRADVEPLALADDNASSATDANIKRHEKGR